MQNIEYILQIAMWENKHSLIMMTVNIKCKKTDLHPIITRLKKPLLATPKSNYISQ